MSKAVFMAATWRALVVVAALGCASQEAEQIEAQNAQLRAELARARASGAKLSRAKLAAIRERHLASHRGPGRILDALSMILSPSKTTGDDTALWNDEWSRSWDPRGISVHRIMPHAEEVKISGYARTAADLAEFQHRLTTSELFAGVQTDIREASSFPPRGEAVRFAFVVLPRYPGLADASAAVTAPPSAATAGGGAKGSENSNPDDRLALARQEAIRLSDALAHERARVTDAEGELAALTAERDALREVGADRFVTVEETESFLEKIRAMSETDGLKVSQGEPSLSLRVGAVLVTSAKMTAVGSLREFASFCHSVAKVPQSVVLYDVELKFRNGGEDFENSLVVASYSVQIVGRLPWNEIVHPDVVR